MARAPLHAFLNLTNKLVIPNPASAGEGPGAHQRNAEIIGISDRLMRRWRERYVEFSYAGLSDRRIPVQTKQT